MRLWAASARARLLVLGGEQVVGDLQGLGRLARGPSVAYRYMKENLNRAMAGDIDDCLDLEATHHVHCGQTEDHRAATRAFVDKREPVFNGR